MRRPVCQPFNSDKFVYIYRRNMDETPIPYRCTGNDIPSTRLLHYSFVTRIRIDRLVFGVQYYVTWMTSFVFLYLFAAVDTIVVASVRRRWSGSDSYWRSPDIRLTFCRTWTTIFLPFFFVCAPSLLRRQKNHCKTVETMPYNVGAI